MTVSHFERHGGFLFRFKGVLLVKASCLFYTTNNPSSCPPTQRDPRTEANALANTMNTPPSQHWPSSSFGTPTTAPCSPDSSFQQQQETYNDEPTSSSFTLNNTELPPGVSLAHLRPLHGCAAASSGDNLEGNNSAHGISPQDIAEEILADELRREEEEEDLEMACNHNKRHKGKKKSKKSKKQGKDMESFESTTSSSSSTKKSKKSKKAKKAEQELPPEQAPIHKNTTSESTDFASSFVAGFGQDRQDDDYNDEFEKEHNIPNHELHNVVYDEENNNHNNNKPYCTRRKWILWVTCVGWCLAASVGLLGYWLSVKNDKEDDGDNNNNNNNVNPNPTNTNETQPDIFGDDGTQGATLDSAISIAFAPSRDETVNVSANTVDPTTTHAFDFACGIHNQTQGVYFQIVPPPLSEITSGQLRLQVCAAASANFPNNMHVRVFTRDGTCVQQRAMAVSVPCVGETSALSWYAVRDETYYIHVQGVPDNTANMIGGQVDLTLQRVLAPVAPNFQGSVANGMLGQNVAVSGNGQLVAAAAPAADNGNGFQTGHVKFYRSKPDGTYQEEERVLRSTIHAEFGFKIDLSRDGKTLAVLSPTSVTIYHTISDFNDLQTSVIWTPVFSKSAPDSFEMGSVALSGDGQTVAFNVVTPNPDEDGEVHVYRKVSANQWDLMGGYAIDFATNLAGDDFYDKAVGLSYDGNRLAFAAHFDKIYLYEWDNAKDSWETFGYAPQADIGSVALDDNGQCVATSSGSQVQVWCKEEPEELQPKGAAIAAPQLSDGTQYFGRSLSLARNATVLAIGHDSAAPVTDPDRAYLYKFGTDQTVWTLYGETFSSPTDADLVDQQDWFGWSVALSPDGTTLVSGAVHNELNGLPNEGMVRITRLFV